MNKIDNHYEFLENNDILFGDGYKKIIFGF
jgi:hypothetical protein